MKKIFILLILLVIILFLLSSRSKESFLGEQVPAFCGTAGFRPSDATYAFFKAAFGDQADISNKRLYTPSECMKLNDGVYKDFKCYRMKGGKKTYTNDNDIDTPYSDMCVGLNNTFVSPAPAECTVDAVILGKANKAYSVMYDKEVLIQDGTFQLYTKNECDLLKGTFTSIEDDLKKTRTTQENIAKAIAANGKEYGTCVNKANGMSYSIACIINGKPTAVAKVSDAAKTAIKDWLA